MTNEQQPPEESGELTLNEADFRAMEEIVAEAVSTTNERIAALEAQVAELLELVKQLTGAPPTTAAQPQAETPVPTPRTSRRTQVRAVIAGGGETPANVAAPQRASTRDRVKNLLGNA